MNTVRLNTIYGDTVEGPEFADWSNKKGDFVSVISVICGFLQ